MTNDTTFKRATLLSSLAIVICFTLTYYTGDVSIATLTGGLALLIAWIGACEITYG